MFPNFLNFCLYCFTKMHTIAILNVKDKALLPFDSFTHNILIKRQFYIFHSIFNFLLSNFFLTILFIICLWIPTVCIETHY